MNNDEIIVNVHDDATELFCLSCHAVIIRVPKGKAKLAMQSEIEWFKRWRAKLKRATLFQRIFMWKEFFKIGGEQ